MLFKLAFLSFITLVLLSGVAAICFTADAQKQIFTGETHRLVGVATPTPLMNCCFAGNTNFLVNIAVLLLLQ